LKLEHILSFVTFIIQTVRLSLMSDGELVNTHISHQNKRFPDSKPQNRMEAEFNQSTATLRYLVR
jgi:hypothetical protein